MKGNPLASAREGHCCWHRPQRTQPRRRATTVFLTTDALMMVIMVALMTVFLTTVALMTVFLKTVTTVALMMTVFMMTAKARHHRIHSLDLRLRTRTKW